MKIHRIHIFEPTRGHELGSARRHWERTGDSSEWARLKAESFTEHDTGEGSDEWREMLLAMSGGNNDNE